MKPPIVVLGGGVIGSSIAYHLALQGSPCVVIDEHRPAGCASGKAAGFLAGTWGDRSTAQLSRLSFDMHAKLATELNLTSYRRLPTLEVRRRGDDGYSDDEDGTTRVSWLDGAAEAEASLLDAETAQVCPAELSAAMLDAAIARGATVLIDEAVSSSREPDPNRGPTPQDELKPQCSLTPAHILTLKPSRARWGWSSLCSARRSGRRRGRGARVGGCAASACATVVLSRRAAWWPRWGRGRASSRTGRACPCRWRACGRRRSYMSARPKQPSSQRHSSAGCNPATVGTQAAALGTQAVALGAQAAAVGDQAATWCSPTRQEDGPGCPLCYAGVQPPIPVAAGRRTGTAALLRSSRDLMASSTSPAAAAPPSSPPTCYARGSCPPPPPTLPAPRASPPPSARCGTYRSASAAAPPTGSRCATRQCTW